MSRLARLAALAVVATAALVLGPVVASQPAGHDPHRTPRLTARIARVIGDNADANLDDRAGKFYAPGVDVERVDCWYTAPRRVACSITLTDGRIVDEFVVVANVAGRWYIYGDDSHEDSRA